MSKKIALEIYEEIRKSNSKDDSESIPQSDEFLHYLNISIGIEPDFAKKIIKTLINSHKIFVIEIASEDKNNDLDRIEGYVVCDLNIIKKLKLFYQDELIRQYEAEHYKRVTYHQLIKEIMPILHTLNNTALGQTVNKAIMMNELERLMEKNFEEYTEEWKDKNLDIEVNKVIAGDIFDKPEKDVRLTEEYSDSETSVPESAKSSDTKNYSDIISKSKNYPLDRVLKIYGVDFFLRAQIRRRQFSYLGKLIESGSFLTHSDLLLLRDMIFQVKRDFESDTDLAGYRDDIAWLERTITHRLYYKNENLV